MKVTTTTVATTTTITTSSTLATTSIAVTTTAMCHVPCARCLAPDVMCHVTFTPDASVVEETLSLPPPIQRVTKSVSLCYNMLF